MLYSEARQSWVLAFSRAEMGAARRQARMAVSELFAAEAQPARLRYWLNCCW